LVHDYFGVYSIVHEQSKLNQLPVLKNENLVFNAYYKNERDLPKAANTKQSVQKNTPSKSQMMISLHDQSFYTVTLLV
jgi:hypothetical protein